MDDFPTFSQGAKHLAVPRRYHRCWSAVPGLLLSTEQSVYQPTGAGNAWYLPTIFCIPVHSRDCGATFKVGWGWGMGGGGGGLTSDSKWGRGDDSFSQ